MRNVLTFCLVILWSTTRGDYLVTSRSANIKAVPSSSAETLNKVDEDVTLALLDYGNQTNGYYKVAIPASSVEGWVYRTLVRRYPGEAPSDDPPLEPASEGQPVPINETLERSYMPALGSNDQLIEHNGYVSCMSRTFNIPKWVYHKISYALLQGSSQERSGNYPKDPGFPELRTSAYTGSGYDHGHLAPAADFKRNEDLYSDSFFMTNMTPQHGCFNQKGWCMLESNVRKWAFDNPASEFYIFSGTIVDNSEDALCLSDGTTITVPGMFFKVVAERRKGKFVRGIAFLIPNVDISGNDVDATKTNIDDVERVTGLNFFSALNAVEEKAVEKMVATYLIEDLAECPKRNTACQKVYAGRTMPEKRTKLVCKD